MIRLAAAAALAALTSSPSLAQSPPDAELPSPEELRNANLTTIGAGVGFTADYEGSNDYRLIPAAAVRMKVGNVSVSTRGLYVYADLVGGSGKLDVDFGPIAGVRLNRTGKIRDDVVDLLPERNAAIEVGGFAGVSISGITNPYDSLGLRIDAVKDVGNAHQSLVLTPVVDFTTPLSRTTLVGASVSADFVSDRFADYYFGISPFDSLASGLPAFEADGGMKSWKVGLLAGHSLSGDLRRGWSIFALANRSQLVGDFKRSPIVSDRGSDTQYMAAAGLAFTF